MEIDNSAKAIQFTPGSLVSARGREWVVLPTPTEFENVPSFLYVKPLDGFDAETTGILTDLEEVKPAKFALPDPEKIGDNRSCRYLRDALRFGVRNGAGPFPSFSRFAFEPRPYQYAPLMLALRQETPRLLIADDVGVGKTIETGMIIRELLDRGECRRFCILCPPYLAEQWRDELYSKFQIDATLVLSSTIVKLERELAAGESIFEARPYTIASIDFIKTDARRAEFLRTAPELVVIDEAHAVSSDINSGARHQRYALARALCDDPNRAVVLVTATPHSGKEGAFRALLGLLDKKFLDEIEFPSDLSGDANKKKRQEIARYFIQRRRVDVRNFLGENTSFPECETKDEGWLLSPAYRELFNDALEFARGLVDDKSGTKREQRIRWWSALSLMRSLASSPAAAEATLRKRGEARSGVDDIAEIDDAPLLENSADAIEELGARAVLDASVADVDEIVDAPLPVETAKRDASSDRKKLNALADRAHDLYGTQHDSKLVALIQTVKKLLKEGYSPIVFCRFIPTVDYVVGELRKALPAKVAISGVTSELPREEREERVWSLEEAEERVLVCTDCLSEGLNLQKLFNATIHYDLSWNPTRHEQREGRVDRFGQSRKTVKSITFYGEDDIIDGLVLDILIKKHGEIKKSLGVSVPVPTDSQKLMETIFNSFLIFGNSVSGRRRRAASPTPLLPGMDQFFDEIKDEKLRKEAKDLHTEWDAAAENLKEALEESEEQAKEDERPTSSPSDGFVAKRQRRSQTFYAHGATMSQIGDLSGELQETRKLFGSEDETRWFVENAIRDARGTVVEKDGVATLTLTDARRDFREYLPQYDQWRVSFDAAKSGNAEYVSRAHPLVAGISEYLLHTALDSYGENALAARCGAIRTEDVAIKTTLLLLRMRFKTTSKTHDGRAVQNLAEEISVVAFKGSPSAPEFLDDDAVTRLLDARPCENLAKEIKTRQINKFLAEFPSFAPRLAEIVKERADALKKSRERVIAALKTGRAVEVVPEAEPDVVGIYVYLPKVS